MLLNNIKKSDEESSDSSSESEEEIDLEKIEKEAKKKKKKAMLLFPDMKDAMTLKPIKEPALSPTGKSAKRQLFVGLDF